MAKQDDYVRYTVRLPAELYEKIKDKAGHSSVNSGIIDMLSSPRDDTWRDYFAGQALAGIASTLTEAEAPHLERAAKEMARAAYLFADAMLTERSKGRAK